MSEHRKERPPHPARPTWATTIQPGRFDARVLDHEFWIDAHATIRNIDELSSDHLAAILELLTARSLRLYVAELIDTFARVVIARQEGTAAGEQLAHDLGQVTIADLEPAEWLETTALVRAIRRTLRTRS